MNKIQKYIQDLKKGAGYDRALIIAERCMKGTHPSNWQHLPKGPIFFPTDVRNKTGFREKDLKKLHNRWTDIYNHLKKDLK